MSTLEDLLRPPTDAEAERAIRAFAGLVRNHYGERLVDVVLFGSRARGDHHPESDADVAIVLRNGMWRPWDEKRTIIEAGFGLELETGVHVQPWIFSEAEWNGMVHSARSALITEARRDHRPIGTLSS